MHAICEVILPPVPDVAAAVAQVLAPFDENGEDGDGDRNRHGFWDFYVIGGRFAGHKLEAMFDRDRIGVFRDRLMELGVTVAGLQCGKAELEPASQIPTVDALWCDHFPESPIKACPLFKHYNDQYEHSDGWPDVMRLAELPGSLKADRVIVAAPHWRDAGRLEAKFMVQESAWNGVNHVKSAWDGTVAAALAMHAAYLEGYRPEYAARIRPGDDWLAVTVDYHT